MDTTQTGSLYEVSEVRIEQWLLAALRMQHGLSLKSRRPRRVHRAVRAASRPKTRGSLWVMLAVSCVGLCLL